MSCQKGEQRPSSLNRTWKSAFIQILIYKFIAFFLRPAGFRGLAGIGARFPFGLGILVTPPSLSLRLLSLEAAPFTVFLFFFAGALPASPFALPLAGILILPFILTT